MTRFFMSLVALMAAFAVARADDSTGGAAASEKAANVIAVWPGVAPVSEGWTQKEVDYANDWDHKAMVRTVTTPTLTAFLPEPAAATGSAVVICPG